MASQLGVPEKVALAHQEGKYRPVAVIRDAWQRLLYVQSAKNLASWGFPQGGIEAGEDPVMGLLREVQEEVGILPDTVTGLRYLGDGALDYEASRADRRGFSHGKHYFWFLLDYVGQETLTVQEDEIASYRWLSGAQVREQLQTARPGKRDLALQVLADLP